MVGPEMGNIEYVRWLISDSKKECKACMEASVSRFAAEFKKNESGWFLFPRDIERRRATFPSIKTCPHEALPKDGKPQVLHDVFDHPAKMNLFLVDALVEYLTAPGDWIIDPFGGTGSTAEAIKHGRNAYLIDVEPHFIETITCTARLLNPTGQEMAIPSRNLWSWLPRAGSDFGEIRFQLGDNRQVLESTSMVDYFDACITSPPYSTALNPGSNPLEVKGREGTLKGYTRSGQNMGQLNPFYWEQAMKTLWVGLFRVMKHGGYVAMVNKDIVKSGQRQLLSSQLIRQGRDAGFTYSEWHKWAPPGTIRQETARNKGGTVIEDEDIIIFEKP